MKSTTYSFVSIVLFALIILPGCNSSFRFDIPYSNTETWESVRTKGSKAYVNQYKKWAESKEKSRVSGSSNGDEHCEERGIDKKSVAFAREFLKAEKAKNGADGRPVCACLPMGESCEPGFCACDEICPNHHGILRSRSRQMNPSKKNSLAFINSPAFSGTAYKKYPFTGGYCSGNNAVLRKFQVLSDMRPDLRSWPAMKKGGSEWRKYTLAQIERLGQGLPTEFVGVENLAEIAQDKEFLEALRNKGGYGFGGANPSFWIQASRSKDMKFTHSKSEDIPARRTVDPDTGKVIPVEGSKKYHSYIKEKVERIASGFPASIPGHSSIHALSSDPTYMEIMGSQAAVDWKSFNNFEDGSGFHGLSSSGLGNDPLEPMSTDNLKTFITQAKAYLPSYPSTYPNGMVDGESWNEKGPFQTLPISIRSTEKSGGTSKHGYHSIEAWSVKLLPPNGLRVCVKDPNHSAGEDDNCNSYIDIPDPQNPSTVSYTGFPGRTIGKFNFTAYGQGHIGSMTERLVAYCRRVKTFPEGDKCSE